MSVMVQVEDAWLRASDVSHMRWDRGYSFTNLIVTMRDGYQVTVRDYRGSACLIETKLLAAIEAVPA